MSRLDMTISGGVTFRKRFYTLQADHVTAVGDLTGFGVTLTLSATAGSTALYTYSGTVVTAATALCEIELTGTETDAITDGQYWYTLEVSNGADVYKPLEGWITKGAA